MLGKRGFVRRFFRHDGRFQLSPALSIVRLWARTYMPSLASAWHSWNSTFWNATCARLRMLLYIFLYLANWRAWACLFYISLNCSESAAAVIGGLARNIKNRAKRSTQQGEAAIALGPMSICAYTGDREETEIVGRSAGSLVPDRLSGALRLSMPRSLLVERRCPSFGIGFARLWPHYSSRLARPARCSAGLLGRARLCAVLTSAICEKA